MLIGRIVPCREGKCSKRMATSPTTTPDAIQPQTSAQWPARFGRRLDLLLKLGVIAFGAAILAGGLQTLWGVVHLAHPDPGFGYLVYGDALQVYNGHWPWADPAEGYVGLLYPPGFPGLLAALMHLRLWSGWGIVVSILASFVLAVIAASVAYRGAVRGRSGSKPLAVLEAGAFGFVCWWLVTCTPYPGLDGRSDTTAWALALGGMLLVPRGLRDGGRVLVASVVLLVAAFWTKQQAEAATAAAVAWALLAVLTRSVRARRAIAFVAAVGVANLAIAGLLYALTDGWSQYYIFEMARQHDWTTNPRDAIMRRAGEIMKPPAIFAAGLLVLGTIAWWRADRPRRGRAIFRDPAAQQAVLLVLFLGIITPLAIYSQRKQGSGENHFIGPLWALGLLAALGWRCAGARQTVARAAAVWVLALAAVGFATGRPQVNAFGYTLDQPNRLRGVVTVTHFLEIPPQLLAAARDGTLLDWQHSDLGMHGGHIAQSILICDATAAGQVPANLEREIATRWYDLVQPFPNDLNPACSGMGKWEDGYFWKLDRLIAAGYAPNPSRYPQGILARRSGSRYRTEVRRLMGCFAPYRLGGVLFRLGDGGGFWCQGARTSPRIRLDAIPYNYSELLTDGTITSIRGSLTITMPNGTGQVEAGARRGTKRAVLAALDDATLARPARLIISIGPLAGAEARAAATRHDKVIEIDPSVLHGARLSIFATAESGARFDFSRLTVRTEHGVLRGEITRRGLPGAGDL
jgi:hypothetical protein